MLFLRHIAISRSAGERVIVASHARGAGNLPIQEKPDVVIANVNRMQALSADACVDLFQIGAAPANHQSDRGLGPASNLPFEHGA